MADLSHRVAGHKAYCTMLKSDIDKLLVDDNCNVNDLKALAQQLNKQVDTIKTYYDEMINA